MSAAKNDPDQAISLILVCGVTFLALWLIWHFCKHPILEVLRVLRYIEMWVINIFSGDRYGACLSWLTHARFGDAAPSPDMINWTNNCFGVAYLQSVPAEDTASYYSLAAPPVLTIGGAVGRITHWLLAAIFVGIGVYTIYFSPRNKFKTKHNLESFIKTQAKMWPVIAPIINFNPIKSSARIPGSPIPDKLPLFAEALSPEEWIAFHKIKVTNNIPERDAVRRALLLQLGPRWGGIDGLPPYVRALFAAFALKGVQKREESDDLLGQISLGWSHKTGFNLDMKTTGRVNSIIRDSAVGGEALKIADQYAYRSTALLGVLAWARSRGGVLAPAQFLWLRGTDRTLWYALNNLGRRAFHSEGAGAMAHFMAEDGAKKPLPIPRVDTAIITLNQYLAERGGPIPPRENAH